MWSLSSEKMRNQYDEFLNEIQKHKMKELWDNEKDYEGYS